MKDINISFIRYYVTLVECKKFNTAAQKLHISQPALSKSIMLLEEHLGTPLLKRFPRGFDLTDAGKYFYETATYFLKLYDDFLYDIDSRVTSLYSGTVRMSSSGVILELFFPEIIIKLREKYPAIKIFSKEEDTNDTVQSLLSHKVDFGTAIYPIPQDIQNNFITHSLLESSFHVVLRRNHPLAAKDSIHISDLDHMDVLTPGEASQVHHSFLALCRQHSLTPSIMCSCSQIHSLIQLTRGGVGLAILPAVFLRSLPPELTHRPLTPALPWKLILIAPKTVASLAVSTTISFVQDYFHSLNPADGTLISPMPDDPSEIPDSLAN